jgi:AcrR family transcriptional regulator
MTAAKNKREQNKAETRERLMAAARREFAMKGYAGTSLRMITTRAELTTGAFYNHFRDKREMYLAILEELSHRLRTMVEEAIQEFIDARRRHPKSSPTLDLLRPAIAKVFQEAIEDQDLFEILRRDGLGVNSEFRNHYRKIVREFTEPMRKGLEDFIQAGFSRPYDTEGLAQVVVILFFSVVIYASHDGSRDREGWVDTLAAMIHGGAKQLSARPAAR